MIRTQKRMVLCITLLCLILTFIWGNSLLSAEASRAFSDWVKRLLSLAVTGEEPAAEGSGLLRKIAHFTEFSALGMCLCWLLGMLKCPRGWGILLGGLTAGIDETIQIFVPGRGPGLLDVGIDTMGVITGIILLTLGHNLVKNKKTSGGQ
jgi:VanZ family protein